MTYFAGYPQDHAGGHVTIDDIGIGHRLRPGRMTLQTSGTNGAIEVDDPVRISWTVRPSGPRPIRHGVLIQSVAAPVQEGLALPHAGDHVDPLASYGRVGRSTLDRAFIEARGCRVHAKVQVRIRGPEHILAGVETTLKGRARR